MKIIGLVIFILSCSFSLLAQTDRFSDKDKIFFESQLTNYQDWLDSRGFGQVLTIDHIEVHPKMLTLFLDVKFERGDSASIAWDTLKASYAQLEFDSLEAAIYHYFTFLMEVPPSMATIEIYNSFGDRVPCFYKAIYVEDGQLSTEQAPCRDKETTFTIDFEDLPENKTRSIEEVEKDWGKKKAFNVIEGFCRDFFELREAEFDVIKRGSYLKFRVEGMRREILPLSFFGVLFGPARENLVVAVNFFDTDKGFMIHINTNGKFGSGLFVPRAGGYRPMEPDYAKELQKYTNKLGEEIRKEILK
ncbi:MAG: hypothetical protein MRZ79_00055 [Bacteroidia bacterium]|nr:hypothetical protein [Bacteroidia bacterium]